MSKHLTQTCWGKQGHNREIFTSLHFPINRKDRWGTIDDFLTSSLHVSLFSTTLWESANSILVHSLMMFSYFFFCLPLRLPPLTVPCKIVFTRPDDLDTWPYHFSLRFLTVIRRSSYGLMACLILLRTATLVTWYLYDMRNICRKHLISMACILFCRSAERVHVSEAYRKMDMTRERISVIFELTVMFLSFHKSFNLISAAVVCAILASISGSEPSSVIIDPKYLKLFTLSISVH